MSPEPQTQSIAGVFTPRLVARLHRDGFEGTLRLVAGGSTRVVYFRRGDIASAASNADADRLHNILIRDGRLTEPQVEMARSKQRPGASLGKVLIDLGFLTPSELLQGARRQVRQILAACFALTDGTWQTTSGPLGPEVTNLGLPTRRLIFDALMEAGDRGTVVREMGSMESVYEPAAGLADALPALRLDPAMEEVGRMIDGAATLREISSRTRLDDFTVSRIVLALEILGLASQASRPEPVAAGRRSGRLIPVEGDDDGAAADVPVHPAGTTAGSDPDLPAPVAEAAWGAPVTARDGNTHDDMATTAGGAPGVSEVAAGEGPPVAAAAEWPPAAAISGFEATGDAPGAPGPDGPAGRDGDEPAEPPPFPDDELPAFAAGPREETPTWQVDPETGEKVHEGPIELTFDGQVAPDHAARSATRVMVAATMGAVLIGALAIVYLLRARHDGEPAPDAGMAGMIRPEPPDGADDGAPEPAVAGVGAIREDAAPIPAPSDAPGADSAIRGESLPAGPQAGDGAAEPAETGPRAGDDAVAPVAVAPQAGDDAVAPVAVAPQAGGDAAVLAAGRSRLDAGDVAGAAAAFREALATLPADRFSLQLLIACEEETVRKAHSALAPGNPLFVTGYMLQGRPCHRLLWGIYPDREAARAAEGMLPAYFSAAGVKPMVVSIARLRGPA